MDHLLSLLIFLPALGALAVLFVPKGDAVRWLSAGVTGAVLLLSLVLWFQYDAASMGSFMTEEGFAFVERLPWIEAFNIEYYIGVDGLSLPMIVLTALLSFLCIFASWNIEKGQKGYFSLFMFLEFSTLGVFAALDFFLFFLFWELMLLPMYFLIGIWGGENKEYAAIKFFLYTMAGSVLMLLGVLALYWQGGNSFDMLSFVGWGFHFENLNLFGLDLNFGKVLFMAFFIAFAVKVPVFPFHTWLPHAHVQAPTAISVILAGVLLKMGTYGILRVCFPLFPEATKWFAPAMAILGVVNILYGALCAMAQKDIKRLVAYSSVSHMGYVLLGMAAFSAAGGIAITGAVFQMWAHGTSTAMMFLLVGVLYDRAHHRRIVNDDGTLGFGGLASQVPIYTGIMTVALFASLGLPGLVGFIAEALVFLGAFSVYQTYTIIAAIGILLTAAYLLWMFKRVFFGPLNEKYKDLPDMNLREILYMTPLTILVIVFGVWPKPILDVLKPTLTGLIQLVE
jgi:NADH-quinone oxidoreductase subunit M